MKKSSVFDLGIHNKLLQRLPTQLQPSRTPHSTPKVCFSRVPLEPFDAPCELVSTSSEALKLINLDSKLVSDHQHQFVQYMAGNDLLPNSEPAAHCYCGHQFGYFAGQLGDGAAKYLGQITNPDTRQTYELQLKGAGVTPYSRTADGRKVLRSSLREYLCSEHMHALNIPTTRSASVIVSQAKLRRDPFYDGNAKLERAAVISRIAPTFLRFGSFEIFKPTDAKTGNAGPSSALSSEDKREMLERMLRFVVDEHFPEISSDDPIETQTLEFFATVVRLTAKLVAQWDCVGFCHGVLNTDNMSILGLTIDYGPFGFLEHYNPDYICNGSDDQGRYCYKNQQAMCKWNCEILAEQLALVADGPSMSAEVAKFDAIYHAEVKHLMKRKLGLIYKDYPEIEQQLFAEWWQTLEQTGADLTCAFRCLAKFEAFTPESFEATLKDLVDVCYDQQHLTRQCESIIPKQYLEQFCALVDENPSALPAIAQHSRLPPWFLEKEIRKHKKAQALEDLTNSTLHEQHRDHWRRWLNLYRERLALETEGRANAEFIAERERVMNKSNPKFILRNHVAQQAIVYSENGEYAQLEKLLHLLLHPFDESDDPNALVWSRPLPPSKPELIVTCSS